MTPDSLQALEKFSSSDISDALCALSSPSMPLLGHIPDVLGVNVAGDDRVSGFAYTAEFVFSSCLTKKPEKHHVDTCPKGHILVIKSPANAPNAVWGGLMTARARKVGCAGVIVEGRIRDLNEIDSMGLKVFAKGQSTMGAAPFCKVGSVGEPIVLADSTPWPVIVKTGDIIVADRDGVVRVPIEHVDQIVEYCSKRVEVDAKCMQDIQDGASIVETFAKHRGK